MNITSKQEAVDNATLRIEEASQSLIRIFEQKIRSEFLPDCSLIIYLDAWGKGLDYNTRDAIRKVVMGLYEAEGWTVKFEDSQRDGSWIELK